MKSKITNEGINSVIKKNLTISEDNIYQEISSFGTIFVSDRCRLYFKI
jgi:hypothetical protein